MTLIDSRMGGEKRLVSIYGMGGGPVFPLEILNCIGGGVCDNVFYYNWKFPSMKPQIHPSCYISPHAVIIGNVVIEKGCNVWPNAVLRGDLNRILVREGANVQDNCVIHVTKEEETIVGKNTSLGHGCIIHGSLIGENCIIGMNACVLDGSKIGNNSVVGAGAVVIANTIALENSLLLGTPAKIVKTSKSFSELCKVTASNYHEVRDEFLKGIHKEYSP